MSFVPRSLLNFAARQASGGANSSTGDRLCLAAFIRRSICQGLSDLRVIIDTADETVLQQVLVNPNHVLASLLPNRSASH